MVDHNYIFLAGFYRKNRFGYIQYMHIYAAQSSTSSDKFLSLLVFFCKNIPLIFCLLISLSFTSLLVISFSLHELSHVND